MGSHGVGSQQSMPALMGLQRQSADLQVDKEGQCKAVQQGETIRPAEKLLAFVLSLQTQGRGAGDSRWERTAASRVVQGLCKLLFWGSCHFSETMD